MNGEVGKATKQGNSALLCFHHPNCQTNAERIDWAIISVPNLNLSCSGQTRNKVLAFQKRLSTEHGFGGGVVLLFVDEIT